MWNIYLPHDEFCAQSGLPPMWNKFRCTRSAYRRPRAVRKSSFARVLSIYGLCTRNTNSLFQYGFPKRHTRHEPHQHTMPRAARLSCRSLCTAPHGLRSLRFACGAAGTPALRFARATALRCASLWLPGTLFKASQRLKYCSRSTSRSASRMPLSSTAPAVLMSPLSGDT